MQNVDTFIHRSTAIEWNDSGRELCQMSDRANQFDKFSNQVIELFKTCCPLTKVPAITHLKKWVSQEIRDAKEFLELLGIYCEYHPHNQELKHFCSQFRVKYNGLLRRTRKQFINHAISTSDNTSQALWKAIKTETNKDGHGDPLTILRTSMCGENGTQLQLANALNNYYLSVVRDTPLRPNITEATYLLRKNVLWR